ncbi:MAG: alkaline phosphatase family protein [Bacteroidetes bacterium]|nr:alkaline phosphatase family protein [Bacteroidota bacterium]
MKKSLPYLLILFFILFNFQSLAQKAENLILFTTDGLRWQEVFGGIDTMIASDKQFTRDKSGLLEKYFDPDINIRRKKLMPFFWSKIATEGVVLGNRWKGNYMDVENNYWFSYPGYNEMLTGYADSLVNSNDKNPNQNITVLEYLNTQKGFQGRVAAFSTWDVIPYIINTSRNQIPVNSGIELFVDNPGATQLLLNDIQSLAPKGHAERHDFLTYFQAREYLKIKQPKVLYISLDDTDGLAHAGQYDDYLEAAHAFDNYLKNLWELCQSLPQYQNKTAFLLTTDHGRGDKTKSEWTSHGIRIKGASQIWAAALGPGIAEIGEATSGQNMFQSQIAATAAAALGIDFKKNNTIPQKTIAPKLQIFH